MHEQHALRGARLFAAVAALIAIAPSARGDELGTTAAPAPLAQPETSAPQVFEAAPAPPPSPPAPYSLPWQLRGAAAATVIRSDTSFARYEDAGSNHGLTVASTLLASFKIPDTGKGWAGLAPLVRVAVVGDSVPASKTPGGTAFVNPLVGATYATPIVDDLRASFFFGATIPIGMGGGDTPDKGPQDGRSKGSAARLMMDNSLFAVNDFTVIPGADIAWVHSGFTAQAEVTLFELLRVRGAAAQTEASKTNLTTGVHLGYFLVPALSLGLDVHYQRWLNAPAAVDKDTTGTLVDNWSASFGPRFHVPLGDGVKLHPGIAYARYLDKPGAAATPNYHVVQIDVPITF